MIPYRFASQGLPRGYVLASAIKWYQRPYPTDMNFSDSIELIQTDAAQSGANWLVFVSDQVLDSDNRQVSALSAVLKQTPAINIALPKSATVNLGGIYEPLVRGTGPLLANPELVSFYWGTFQQADINAIQKYLIGLADYMSSNQGDEKQPVVRQYGVKGATVGGYYLEPHAPAHATENDVKQKIQALQQQNLLPGFRQNRLFVVFTRSIIINAPFGPYCSGFGGWAGYHDYWTDVGGIFAICPDPSVCEAGDLMTNWQEIISHEVFEACTDPLPWTGWARASGSEGGDGYEGQFEQFPFGAVQKFADNSLQMGSVWSPAAIVLPAGD